MKLEWRFQPEDSWSANWHDWTFWISPDGTLTYSNDFVKDQYQEFDDVDTAKEAAEILVELPSEEEE